MNLLRWGLVVAYLCWAGFWFWAFSFAYSDSFFRYNLATRLPVLLLALGAVAVPPWSAWMSCARHTAVPGRGSRPGPSI